MEISLEAIFIKRRAVSWARSVMLSMNMYSEGLWMSPPRTPMVSMFGRPAARMVLPSDAPPVSFQDRLRPRSLPQD